MSSSKSAWWGGFRTLGLTSLLVALLADGCAPSTSPLRVGMNIWPGYEPLRLARSLGYLTDEEAEPISFPSAMDVMRAFRNRTIDVAAVTADEALVLASTDPEVRLVLVCDYSSGADMILARPEFKRMEDLRGRRFAVEPEALGAYMLARALELSGLTVRDVHVVPTRMAEMEKLMARRGADAAVVFEPVASRLLANGNVRVFDSTRIPGEVVDVLVTRVGMLQSRGPLLRRFVADWFHAVEYFREHAEDAARRVADREQLSPAEFLRGLQGLKLADRHENERAFGRGPDGLASSLLRLEQVMLKQRLLSATVELESLLDSRLVAP